MASAAITLHSTQSCTLRRQVYDYRAQLFDTPYWDFVLTIYSSEISMRQSMVSITFMFCPRFLLTGHEVLKLVHFALRINMFYMFTTGKYLCLIYVM